MNDKLPFEQSLKDGLKIYAKRWLLFLSAVIVCLIPLAFIYWR